jgi:hypothetical protein
LTNFIPFIALPWEFFHIKIKLGMESELNQGRGEGVREEGREERWGWSTELTFCLGGGWGGNGRQYLKRDEAFSSFDAEKTLEWKCTSKDSYHWSIMQL